MNFQQLILSLIFLLISSSVFAQINIKETPVAATSPITTQIGTSTNVVVGGSTGNPAANARNTYVGFEAGANASATGIKNTFIGTSAGRSNTSGTLNTFVGHLAGDLNTTGHSNTFLGEAGYRNTTGIVNTFIGGAAGSQNITGNYNTSLGGGAGAYNNNHYNVFLGASASHYNTGTQNVTIGSHAGYQLHGSGNVIIGNNAAGGYPGTYLTCNNSTLLGKDAYFSVSGLTNATAIGYSARVATSNSIVLGGTGVNAVNVGVGTESPAETLDVNGTIRANSPTYPGRDYKIVCNSRQNIYAANDLVTYSGGGKLFVINTAAGSTNAFMVANGTESNKLFYVKNNGKVQIGNISTPGSYKLYVETGILTEKLKVALKTSTDWADYVFANNYQLKPLAEVEAFVKENKHLPNVPSAQELVNDGGVDVGQMLAKQMQKIEELTLYVIDLNKQNEVLKAEVSALKKQ